VETAEIHLATGFQNLLYEHPAFPEDLRAEMESWCASNTADERQEGETDAQFLYKTRKKALGPYKRELWDLTTKDEIISAQEQKFRYLFEQLGVGGSRAMVERYVAAPRRSRPLPDSLRVAVGAR
jgi:hypothetical protein